MGSSTESGTNAGGGRKNDPEIDTGEPRDVPKGKEHKPLFIFVNRRKFDEEHGVQAIMTGRQLAALVEVPADAAVVRRDTGKSQTEVGIDERVPVNLGDHFLVTRRTVEGGNVTRAD